MKNQFKTLTLKCAIWSIMALLFTHCKNDCENCEIRKGDSFKTKQSGSTTVKRQGAGTLQTSFANPIEDTLAISTNTVSVEKACGFIQDGLQYLEVDNSNFPAEIEEIDSAAFHDLRRDLRSIRMSDPYCQNYITALKISLGLNDRTDDHDTIKLLYQPVYMCRNNGDSMYSVSYTSPIYFVYKNSSFVQASQNELEGLERYTNKIHFNSPVPRAFRDRPDSTGDTKSVFYTFQELDSVVIHNDVDKVKIWNFAFRVKVGLVKYTKHSLILSPYDLGCDKKGVRNKKLTAIRAIQFVGKFADRSHLCPPSCEVLYYPRLRP